MPPEYKALNIALWAPPILAGCVLFAHAIGRRLPLRERPLATPRGALVAVTVAFGLPLAAVVVAEWQLVRQLDLRPFVALVVALLGVVVFLWLHLGAPLRRPPL